jgi:hypothetical protein
MWQPVQTRRGIFCSASNLAATYQNGQSYEIAGSVKQKIVMVPFAFEGIIKQGTIHE